MPIRLVAPLGDRAQQDALLELLNSTPVVNGVDEDHLADTAAARSWQQAHGGDGSAAEHAHLLDARDVMQAVFRGQQPVTALEALLETAAAHARATPAGLTWEVDVPPARRLAVEMIATFVAVQENLADRMRACANSECTLFLIDRSKANKARWCSMAVCGNRMKARLHYQRTHGTGGTGDGSTEA